jgi:hypothetical protein
MAKQSSLIKNFRAASIGLGEYCPKKNELRVDNGEGTYRFACVGNEIIISSHTLPAVHTLVSSDATVSELQRFLKLESPGPSVRHALGRISQGDEDEDRTKKTSG